MLDHNRSPYVMITLIDTSGTEQNGRHFEKGIFIYMFQGKHGCVWVPFIRVKMFKKWFQISTVSSTLCMKSSLMLRFDRQICYKSLQWHHNERYGVSDHQRLDCIFNRLFRRRSKKTSKLHITGLCEGNSPVTGEFPARRTVTRKILPFDNVIMNYLLRVTSRIWYRTIHPRICKRRVKTWKR